MIGGISITVKLNAGEQINDAAVLILALGEFAPVCGLILSFDAVTFVKPGITVIGKTEGSKSFVNCCPNHFFHGIFSVRILCMGMIICLYHILTSFCFNKGIVQ
jgi:hypothetical protein